VIPIQLYGARELDMGEVVAFQARAKCARIGASPSDGEAQILFFLGVRYMRMEESANASGEMSPERSDTPRGRGRRKSRARA
jgi:hypothetical protein